MPEPLAELPVLYHHRICKMIPARLPDLLCPPGPKISIGRLMTIFFQRCFFFWKPFTVPIRSCSAAESGSFSWKGAGSDELKICMVEASRIAMKILPFMFCRANRCLSWHLLNDNHRSKDKTDFLICCVPKSIPGAAKKTLNRPRSLPVHAPSYMFECLGNYLPGFFILHPVRRWSGA